MWGMSLDNCVQKYAKDGTVKCIKYLRYRVYLNDTYLIFNQLIINELVKIIIIFILDNKAKIT